MIESNIAMQLHNWLGVAVLYRNTPWEGRSPSHTKKGPGRIHKQGKIVNVNIGSTSTKE